MFRSESPRDEPPDAWAAFAFSDSLMQTTTMEFAQMSKNEFSNGDFIACVPHQIEDEWHEKWGPLLAGFPVNIMYACVREWS